MTTINQNSSNFLKGLLFWTIFQLLFFSGGFSFLFPMLPKWGVGIVMGSVITLGTLLTTIIFLKFDELTLNDLGMTLTAQSVPRFFFSLFAGMLLFGAFYIIYYLFTPITLTLLEGVSVVKSLLLIFLVFLTLGIMEEIAFRGYLLRKLDSALGMRGAIYITSIAFGFYHGLSIDSLIGPAIWGLYYAVLAYWSKGLAIPIGFHVGVNIIQAIFNEKTKWVDGIWAFEIFEKTTLFTIQQVTIILQILLFLGGISLVEYYIRVIQVKTK